MQDTCCNNLSGVEKLNVWHLLTHPQPGKTSLQKFYGPKTSIFQHFFDNFASWSQVSLSATGIRNRESESGIANYDHFCVRVPNMVGNVAEEGF